MRIVRLLKAAARSKDIYTDRNRNSPMPSYTGRGRDNDNPYDTCRSRWLFDGDSCVEDDVRGREMGSWDYSDPTQYGYTVSVGDVPCDPSNDQPCPPDPNAHICRPLPGLTEWSLGAPEYGKISSHDRKTLASNTSTT